MSFSGSFMVILRTFSILFDRPKQTFLWTDKKYLSSRVLIPELPKPTHNNNSRFLLSWHSGLFAGTRHQYLEKMEWARALRNYRSVILVFPLHHQAFDHHRTHDSRPVSPAHRQRMVLFFILMIPRQTRKNREERFSQP